MNKKELLNEMQYDTGLEKSELENVLTTLLSTIRNLKEGEKLPLSGFGTFSRKKRNARIGRNPKTGESVNVPASTTIVFKAGKDLKNSL